MYLIAQNDKSLQNDPFRSEVKRGHSFPLRNAGASLNEEAKSLIDLAGALSNFSNCEDLIASAGDHVCIAGSMTENARNKKMKPRNRAIVIYFKCRSNNLICNLATLKN